MSNKIAIIIPSRYASKRFPGKPLAKIKELSVVNRVWRIAKQVKPEKLNQSNIDVIIATDSKKIYDHCKNFGADVRMTPESCKTGTDRVSVIASENSYDIIVNLQGDAVLTPPWIIEDTLKRIIGNPNTQITTPAVKLNEHSYTLIKNKQKEYLLKDKQYVGGTTVTFSKTFKALYFSKNIIPFIRDKNFQKYPIYKHIGLYVYRKNTLIKLSKLPPGELETVEGLEQLRALENDIPIDIVIVDTKGHSMWSIDNPEDISIVENIIDKEGDILNL